MAKLSELSLTYDTDDVFETEIFSKALEKMPNLKHLCIVSSLSLDPSELLEEEAYLQVCKQVLVTVSQTKNIVVDNGYEDGTILKIYRRNAQAFDAEIETLNIKTGFCSQNDFFERVKEFVETHLQNHYAAIEEKEEW